MHVTMVNPILGMLVIKEIPTVAGVDKKGTTNEFIDKMSALIIRPVYKWAIAPNKGL